MKKSLLLLLTFTFLFAASTFWETVIEIEKEFYTSRESRVFALSTETEGNATAAGQSVGETVAPEHPPGKEADDLSSVADEKIRKFNILLSVLKERPYEVNNPNNPFYNPASSEQLRTKLKTRISVNKQYNYDLAVVRDEIALLELDARKHIYGFFIHLADRWTEMSNEELLEFFKKSSQWLRSINVGKYTRLYREAKENDDKISKKIVENYENLRMHYHFFSEFLEYVMSNPSMFRYRSLTSLFKLNEIIDRINSVELFAKINTDLRHINTDMGRLLIFLLIMVVAWGSSYLFYYKLYAFLKRLIEAQKHETDELLLANLNNIRRPLFILVITFGFRLGLEVLFHPAPLPEKLAIFFFAIVVATVAYILILIVDSLFFDYMVKKGELKNKQLRQELINLILSIIKVTVVIIAISILLVRLGVNITGLVASLGIGGLAVALAAQNTLSNFFGLLKIIFDNSFSQGDWIETKDTEGTVVEIGFISTMIRTFDNALITVPNATLANTPLKNWSKRTVGRRIKMHVGVTYGSKREDVMKAIEEIERMLMNHPGIATPKKIDRQLLTSRSRREKKLVSMEDKYGVKTTLLVYLDKFSDSSINILIYCFSKSVIWQEWLDVKQDVLLKIWEILESYNLDFAFPSESLYFDPENIKESFKPFAKTPKIPE
ncbi:mechanosensitive ion channel family protein [Hydrogenimonas cancrithermarum]|uniref:MscS family protein n=1 Tax=Hydrogenimonas cancrithermarum TaxID=2993563 RepID=A0ABN6WRS9_9BACT|nr:mechanosensitive ion channel family protein [Hydrogenimonas cancrithermarum]BDY11698.1 putative MscS family protein [Hydrogenimonas cancrithermarum]